MLCQSKNMFLSDWALFQQEEKLSTLQNDLPVLNGTGSAHHPEWEIMLHSQIDFRNISRPNFRCFPLQKL
jgi:hypothetical protein